MPKKKIFLLSDDLRMHSGVATISRELVLGTANHYDWVQLAGAVTHPDKGKIADMSEATNKLLGRNDCYVKLYPIDGYGDEDTLFAVMNIEKPDAVLHFTDPRFWTWLYMIERQIRSKVPLCYYNIWDDLPYPMYNRPYYESCDLLMSISKQTYNINKQVLGPNRCCTVNGIFHENGHLVLTLKHLIEVLEEAGTFAGKPFENSTELVQSTTDSRIVEFKKRFQEFVSQKLVGTMIDKDIIATQEYLNNAFTDCWNKFDEQIKPNFPYVPKNLLDLYRKNYKDDYGSRIFLTNEPLAGSMKPKT